MLQYINLMNRFMPPTVLKKVAEFKTIVNTKTQPAYIFNAGNGIMIKALKRLGGKGMECFHMVFFLDLIQSDRDTNLIGRVMHRIPGNTNF